MMKTRAYFIGMVCCSINTNKKERKPNKKSYKELAAEELQANKDDQYENKTQSRQLITKDVFSQEA